MPARPAPNPRPGPARPGPARRRRYGDKVSVWADGPGGDCVALAWRPAAGAGAARPLLSVATAADTCPAAGWYAGAAAGEAAAGGGGDAAGRVVTDAVSVLAGIRAAGRGIIRAVEVRHGARTTAAA